MSINQCFFFQKKFDIWPLLFWIFLKKNSKKTSQVFQDFVITIFDGCLKKEIPTQHWLFPVFGGSLIQCWFFDHLYMPITSKFYLCELDFGKFQILAIWGQTIIEFATKKFQNFAKMQNFLPKKKKRCGIHDHSLLQNVV